MELRITSCTFTLCAIPRHENNSLTTRHPWQLKEPATPLTQEVVTAFLANLVIATPPHSPPFAYLRAIHACFRSLSKTEYFSELGQKLTIRQLAEALDTARNTNACQTSIDSTEILAILDSDIYRDGGSRFILLATTAGELPAILPIAFSGDDPMYRDLFPCDFSKIDYFLPIPKHSKADSFLLSGIRRCLSNPTTLSVETLERAQEFLDAAQGRNPEAGYGA